MDIVWTTPDFVVMDAMMTPVTASPRLDLRHAPARWWLLIGVLALAVAGVLAGVLVGARSPGVKDDPVFQTLFQQVLVIHVDLSVLVWFLAVCCMVLSLATTGNPVRQVVPYLDASARGLFLLGIFLMTGAVFDPHAAGLKSNYIPMLQSPVFFVALACFAAGVGLMLAHCAIGRILARTPKRRVRAALYFHHLVPDTAVALWVILLVAGMNFYASAANLMTLDNIALMDDPELYYDTLFWAGGHVLQFAFTALAGLCWCWLARSQGLRVSRLLYRVSLAALILPLLATVYGMLYYPADAPLHKFFYTKLMIEGNGVAPMLLLIGLGGELLIAKHYWNWRDGRAVALVCSLILFFVGGAIGLMITGENVRVPAHYHGAIVGITVGLMGLAVALLPHFGFRRMHHTRLARWQPVVLTVGQLMHVGGLAWSGGYGVLRKTVGGLDALPVDVKIAMGIMGTGGLIAIIGGLMFVILVWRSIRGRDKMLQRNEG